MRQLSEFRRVASIDESHLAGSGLPGEIVELLRINGAGVFRDGFLRLLDPTALNPRLSEWFENAADVVPFAMTALGDLLVWHRDAAWFASPRDEIVRRIDATPADLVQALDVPVFTALVLHSAPYGGHEAPAYGTVLMPVPWRSLGGAGSADTLRPVSLEVMWTFHAEFSGRVQWPDGAVDGVASVSSWADVRAAADDAGVPADGLVLPGDTPSVVEGALRVGRTDAGGWVLESVDYGQPRVLVRVGDELAAMRAVAAYVARPLPAAVGSDAAAREQIFAAAAPHWMELAGRLDAGELVIDVPAGVLLNRLGALDGFLLYPADTSLEARSLPPTTLGPVHEFLVRRSFRARVGLTPAWFGRPGGGVRVTIADAGVGIRDLVVDGTLARTVRTD